MAPAGVDDGPAVEAGVRPQRERAAGAGATHPLDGLGDESRRPPAGAGVAAAQTGVHHLAAAGNGGEQRMVAPHAAVAELAALLGQPVGLADRGVDVDGHGVPAGPNTRSPGAGQRGASDLVQLADVTPGERAQEGAEGGGRPQLMAEDRLRAARPQRVSVVDALTARQRRVDERHRLVAGVGVARRLA